jgi:hypothetical protein
MCTLSYLESPFPFLSCIIIVFAGTFYADPNQQFISLLAKNKKKLNDSPAVKDLIDKVFLVRISLADGCENDVYRRFTVPASTPLNIFHDQILTPILGFARAYHGYIFVDGKDGNVNCSITFMYIRNGKC